MTQFANHYLSHEHSLDILNLLYGYDSFLDSLSVIADMGCGAGLDAEWWATLETRDEPVEPRNYKVYAVDRNLSQVDHDTRQIPNISWLEYDFEEPSILPQKVDLMWSHDAFQYVTNPLNTLANWNRQLNVNGMLVMAIPQSINYVYGRLNFKTESYVYHNYSIANMVYMLAVNGFDCHDAYFYKNAQSNWLYLAVYKSLEPMDPKTTSLHNLADRGLLHNSILASLNKYGYINHDDIVYPWLDKDFYRATV